MTTQHANRRPLPALLGALTLFVALLGCASPAIAGTGIAAAPNFPSPVTVGSSGAATFTITNTSNGAENAVPVTLTDMQMVPACGTAFGTGPDNDCPGANAQPGVFTLSATGTGLSGTACAAQSFNITLNNAATGQVTFAPVGGPVVLQPTGTAGGADRCSIGVTYTLVAMPTQDSAPTAPGVQTTSLGYATGFSVVNGGTSVGTGTGSNTVTVLGATVPINTVAARSSSGTISDTATIGPKPAGAPAPTGTVTFNVFGPGDTTCTGPIRFSSTNAVTGGTTATSGSFLPGPTTGGPGTYRFVAAYSGDPNYQPVTSSCSAPNEQVVVPSPVIDIVKTASPPSRVTPGGSFTFTVVVSNPSTIDPVMITSLTDNIYGNLSAANPNITNNTCGTLQGATVQPGASAPACSFVGQFTGTAGSSQTDIVVVNAIDPSGFTVTDNDDATVTITPKLIVPLSTVASRATNGTISDRATIGSPPPGAPAPTGTVTFNVYGPGDTTCTGPVRFSSTNAVTGGTTAVSGSFLPGPATGGAGTYRFVAIYSGDATYAAVTSPCGAVGESVDVPVPAPVVTTGSASSITGTGATLPGTVNPNGLSTTYTFEYGPTLSFGSITPVGSAGAGTSSVAVSASLTGLSPGTTYYYRAVATNSSGTTFGTVRSFRTTGTAQPPVAITGAASAVTNTGATLNGQVNPKAQQTSYLFEYGTTTAFGQNTPAVALDNADALEPVSATLTGLASNTTYLYRTVATNATGTTTGAVRSFSTGPGGPPIVVTGAATSVTATGATLNGTVNPRGLQTNYTFEYGPTTAFGSISPVSSAGAGSSVIAIGQPITGLSPNTTYLYRLVASNASGTTTGSIGSFTTGAGI